VKLVSTMEEPSRGSKATEKPSPSMSTGSGTSSLHAYLHTCCRAGRTTACQLGMSACRWPAGRAQPACCAAAITLYAGPLAPGHLCCSCNKLLRAGRPPDGDLDGMADATAGPPGILLLHRLLLDLQASDSGPATTQATI
jgi:hypothetical protein